MRKGANTMRTFIIWSLDSEVWVTAENATEAVKESGIPEDQVTAVAVSMSHWKSSKPSKLAQKKREIKEALINLGFDDPVYEYKVLDDDRWKIFVYEENEYQMMSIYDFKKHTFID